MAYNVNNNNNAGINIPTDTDQKQVCKTTGENSPIIGGTVGFHNGSRCGARLMHCRLEHDISKRSRHYSCYTGSGYEDCYSVANDRISNICRMLWNQWEPAQYMTLA
ncbi:MAG: hypothetical protein WCC17_08430 [Candidatus Nitrosopolaris sp.]